MRPEELYTGRVRREDVRILVSTLPLALACLVAAAACGEGSIGVTPRATPRPAAAASPEPKPEPEPSPSPRPAPEITLVAVGDVMLGRTLGEGVLRDGHLYPFEEVADILREADVTFANLESPLSEGGTPAAKDFVFLGPPQAAQGLAEAGIDIVSLANNHALDYALEGLAETRAALEMAGVAYVGVGDSEAAARSPVIVERKGIRLAFLAYVNTPPDSGSGFDASSTAAGSDRAGVAWATVEAVAEDVAAAAKEADVVIVSLHTGDEYRESANELQVALAHAAVDAGASLVLGHHPHVLQGVERYGEGLIIYSLGNFVFDFDQVDFAQPGLPSALSAVLQVQITKEGVASCQLVAMGIDADDGRPHRAEAQEAQAVLERMRRLSDGSCGLA